MVGGLWKRVAALENDDLEKARQCFKVVDGMRGSSGDGPSRFYLHLLERGEPIHQGVYDMTEK